MAPLGLWLDVAWAYRSCGQAKQFVSLLEQVVSGEVAHQYRQRGLPYLPDQVRAWCGLWEHALEECAAGGLVGAAAKASARLQLGHTVAPFRAKIEEADPEGGEIAPFVLLGQQEMLLGDQSKAALEKPFMRVIEGLRSGGLDAAGAKNVAAHLGLARISFAAGKYDEALRRLGSALTTLGSEACPPCVRLGMGACYAAMGRTDLAEAAFKRVLQLERDNPDALLGLATLHMKGGQGGDHAGRLLLRAYEADPGNARVLVRVGELALARGQVDVAGALAEALTQEGRDLGTDEVRSEAYCLKAGVLAARGQAGPAQAHFQDAMRVKTSGLARFGVAKSLLSRGGPADVAAAITHLEGVQKDADEAPDVMKALGILYKHEGRPELATEYLRKAEGLAGEDPDVQEALGELLAASDPLAAVRAYDRAVGLHEAKAPGEPVDARLLHNQGVARFNAGDLSGAKSSFEDARPRVGEGTALSTILNFNVARVQEDFGELDAADQGYAAVLADFPGFTDCRLRRALVQFQREADGAKALAMCEEILAEEPDHPETLAVVGYINSSLPGAGPRRVAREKLERLEKCSEASEAYAKVGLANIALKKAHTNPLIDPSNPESDSLWKDVTTNLKFCKEKFLEALKNSRGNIYAANGLGCVLAEEGSYTEAQQILAQMNEAVLAAGGGMPAMPSVTVNLGHTFLALGKAESAIKMYRKVLETHYRGVNSEIDLFIAKAYCDVAHDFGKAVEHAGRALETAEAGHDLYRYNLGACKQRRADYLVDKPRPQDDSTKLPELLLAVQEFKDALQIFSALNATYPDRTAHEKAQRTEEEKQTDRRGRALHLNTRQIFVHVGYCAKRREEAQAKYEMAVRKERERELSLKKEEAEMLVLQKKKEADEALRATDERLREQARQERARENAERLQNMQEQWSRQPKPTEAKESGGPAFPDIDIGDEDGGIVPDDEEEALAPAPGAEEAEDAGEGGGGLGLESSDEEEAEPAERPGSKRAQRPGAGVEGGAAPDLPGEGSLEDAPRPEGETADEGGEVRARKRQKAILEEDD